MAARAAASRARRFWESKADPTWWLQPFVVFLILSSLHRLRHVGRLSGRSLPLRLVSLLPSIRPKLFGEPAQCLGWAPKPAWWPAWLLFSPALLILWAPGGFPLHTCYYYRGRTTRHSGPITQLRGGGTPIVVSRETLPAAHLQNVHRFFLYLALLFSGLSRPRCLQALWFTRMVAGHRTFGIGVGTIVLALNTTLLGGYTLGCHSFRH